MNEKKVMKLASRGKRLGAFCIDSVVPAICIMIYFIAFTMFSIYARRSIGGGFGTDPFQEFGYPYGYGYGYGYDSMNTGGIAAAVLIATLLMLIYTVVQIVFYTKSKTIGKAALGLEVVSSENGKPIGFWKMLFREWFVKQASAAIFLIGYIWVLIDEKNRGWHDKILDTYVIDLKETERMHEQARRRARAEAARRRKEQAKAAAAAAEASGAVSVQEMLREPEEVRHHELDEVDVVTETVPPEVTEAIAGAALDVKAAAESAIESAETETAEDELNVITEEAECDAEPEDVPDAEHEAGEETVKQEGE